MKKNETTMDKEQLIFLLGDIFKICEMLLIMTMNNAQSFKICHRNDNIKAFKEVLDEYVFH